jgi:hypothetical protein
LSDKCSDFFFAHLPKYRVIASYHTDFDGVYIEFALSGGMKCLEAEKDYILNL